MSHTKKYDSKCGQCHRVSAFPQHRCLECGDALCSECPRMLGDEHYCSYCYQSAVTALVRKNQTISAFARLHRSTVATLEAA